MTGERTLPNLGLLGFWTGGSDGWDTGMDQNMLMLSSLAQMTVISRTTAVPASPADGAIYIVPANDATNPNKIAIRDNSAWTYKMPKTGWTAFVQDSVELVYFTGAVWKSIGALGGGRLKSFQWITATGTYTKPAGIRYALVFCLGGGGGGGGAAGAASNGACGGGGGAGGLSVKFIDMSAVTTVAATIGAGGAAGTAAGGNGGTGGTTSFGAYCSAAGGVGGSGQTAGTWAQIVAGGYGGNASDGDFNFTGGAGSPGIRLDYQNGIAGRGAAAAIFGGGGNGYAGNSDGQVGIARGDGGGGGVVANSATGHAGGAGASGMIWVWEFD